MNISLDAALITLKTTNAGTALINKPLVALSYAKYLKDGPNITKIAYNEIKSLVSDINKQTKELKAIRDKKVEGSTDITILVPIENTEGLDLDSLPGIAEIDLGSNDGEVKLPDVLEEIEIPDEPQKK